MYIEGVDIAKDLQGTQLLNYLGINYGDDGEQVEVELLYNSEFPLVAGVNFFYRGGFDAHFSVDHLYSDVANLLFRSEDGVERMFLNETETYKAISSSIIFGALTDGKNLNKKAYLISEMVDCFLDSTLISAVPEADVIHTNFNFQVYPNPFTDFCKIEFEIEEPSEVQIEVINGFGQKIHVLHEGILPVGHHQFKWDATDRNGWQQKPGVYYVKLMVDGKVNCRGVILR